MATVLITGGTGLIGKRLTQLLIKKRYDVTILTRNASLQSSEEHLGYANWDIKKGMIDKDAISKADCIIHLAGAGVADKRWTKERKKVIQQSRTASSDLLVKALRENENKVKAIVSASAIGWYGPDNKESMRSGFNETHSSANDFLGTTCKLWEESIKPVEEIGKRLVRLRTGVILSNDGGALVEFKNPLKAGVAAILGSGEQTISWIHIDDICRLYMYALENENINGAYNAVAPQPTTNKKLTLELAKQVRGKAFISLHVPSFVLKLILGEMSVEVLKSATVSAEKIKSTGFTFLYPSIEAALKELVGRKNLQNILK